LQLQVNSLGSSESTECANKRVKLYFPGFRKKNILFFQKK